MVVPDLFSFIDPTDHEKHLALRLWYLWVDRRITEHPWWMPIYWKHEIPDVERVDFVFSPFEDSVDNNDQKIIPWICTDLHWKEFWNNCKHAKLPIEIKFLNLGIDPSNWNILKRARAFYFHRLGVYYNPLPAVCFRQFRRKRFYCIKCGIRTDLPQEIKKLREVEEVQQMGELNFGTPEYDSMVEDVLKGPDFICPGCGVVITGLEKLNYIALFGEWALKNFDNILNDICDYQGPSVFSGIYSRVKAFGISISSLGTKLRTNNHVPAPKAGRSSHELSSSSMIKPVPKGLLDF